jgi:hypothetical protein
MPGREAMMIDAFLDGYWPRRAVPVSNAIDVVGMVLPLIR